MDIKQQIREAKLPENTVSICLRGDLVAEFERLDRLRAEQERVVTDSLAGSGVRQIAEQMEALRTEMAGHVMVFRLRALTRPRWRDLMLRHPPRDGHKVDTFLGVNEDTFFASLLRECTIEPTLDDDDWTMLLTERFTDQQWDTLTTAAWNLNRKGVDVPFSLAASLLLPNSAPT